MAKHPQNSVRGLLYKGAIGFGSTGIFALNYSEGTAVLTSNSTGVLSTPAGINPSGQAISLTANSTAIVVPVLYVGAIPLTANSTGLLISGAQISTA